MVTLEAGDIVQLGPACHNPAFRYALLVVTRLHTWGITGYVQAPGGGQAYYRARPEEFEPTGGKAQWWRPAEI